MKFNKAILSIFTIFALMFSTLVNAKSYLIPSGSMFPYFETNSYHEFTRYYNSKELLSKLQRFDVIGFKLELADRYSSFEVRKSCQKNIDIAAKCIRNDYVFYTKRLIGLPGDSIKMKGNILYINGTKLKYSAANPSQSKINAGIKELRSNNKNNGGFKYYLETYQGHSTMIAVAAKYGRTEKTDLNIKLAKDEYFVLGDNRIFSTDSRTYGVIKASEITHLEN